MSSLDFTANANSGVDVGNDSSLEDLSAYSIISWVHPTSLVADDIGRVWAKDAFASGFHNLQINHNGGTHTGGTLWVAQRSNAGDIHQAVSDASNLVVVNTWNFIAATGSFAVTAPNLYKGLLTSTVAEVTGYTLQTVGTDVPFTTAGNIAVIGNQLTDNQSFPGYIAFVGVWNRILTLGELKAQQFRPHTTSGCVGFWYPGMHGAAAMPSLCGNTGNNGTTFTNVSVAAGVPLGPLFGADDAKPPYTAMVAAGTILPQITSAYMRI